MSVNLDTGKLMQMGTQLHDWLEENPTAYKTTAMIAGQLLCKGAEVIGKQAYSLTGGRASLNQVVPESVRNACRHVGSLMEKYCFYPITDRVMQLDARHPNFQYRGYVYAETVRAALIAPIVEEILTRLPTIAAFELIDALIGDSMLGTVAKVGVTFASATLFTYMHHANPQPGRAASLFSSGVMSVFLSNKFSLATSMIDHALNNVKEILTKPS